MDFVPEETIREVVGRARAEHERSIRGLVPGADVKHVGASAVPGALTKGDLDLLVSVPAVAFDRAQRALGERYADHQPESWTATFASFRQEPADEIPVGIQLVESGSDEERRFLEWRDRLSGEPGLLADYNSFKRSQVGASLDRYTAEKAGFIDAHMGPS
jgi:GrpB-like predicted nucleotidyltransferase (UPF0157 family)